jgi:hypothetical protein
VSGSPGCRVNQEFERLTLGHRRPIARTTSEMRDILLDVRETLQIHQGVPRSIDPWLQKALYLEDSLGYILPVPLETICSWEVSLSPPSIQSVTALMQ